MKDTQKMKLMPDSLDLVERAKLGLNGLLGTVCPEFDYEPHFLTFFGANPPYFVHWSTMVSGVMPKYLEAIALLRNMSGATFGKDIEDGIINSLLNNAREDGLVYDRKDPRRPWNVGVGYGKGDWDEDYSNLAGDGRFLNALYYYYQMTGDDIWKNQMKRTAERIYELAIFKDDYAYYPNPGCGNDFSYPRESGWTTTAEPMGPREGAEGSTIFYLAQPIRGLIKWYKISGDEKILDLCKRLTKFIMKSKFWGGLVEFNRDYGATRAHWWGHVHGTLAALRGLLEYGMTEENYNVISFVRDGYEWMRHNMCIDLGLDSHLEGCATGDLTALGIQLSDCGIGDYWDDVDCVVRNSLAEAQTSNIELVKSMVEAAPKRPKDYGLVAPFDPRYSGGFLSKVMPGQECIDNVIERSIGAFNNFNAEGIYGSPCQMSCCTANGNQGFYYAWEAVLRYNEGTATVNLLFNRISQWMDVESYLPYEGKIILKNKTCHTVNVRIPSWTKRSRVKCTVNGKEVKPEWTGLYASLNGLAPQDKIVVEFPVEIKKKTLYIPNINRRSYVGTPMVYATMKGSTCLGTERTENPRNLQNMWYPLYYGREKYLVDKAPMKEVDGYIAQKPIKWY